MRAGKQLWRAYVAITAPLRSEDGRISWSKLVTCAVLALYGSNRPVPQLVAVVIVAASYGMKPLMAALGARKEIAE